MSTYQQPAAAEQMNRPVFGTIPRVLHAKPPSARHWGGTRWLALLGIVALGVAVTFDAWRDIFWTACNDEEASHIWLVPVIAAWLIWRRRGRLRRCAPSGLLLGPILIVAGAFLYLFGALYPLMSPWHAGAILLVVGCALSVLGKDTLFQLLPAFAVLIFLVPVPGRIREQIAIPLEGIAAQTTQVSCEILGMPVTRLGNDLKINGAEVGIAEACNGLRMVFSLTLVSYAVAFSLPLRNIIRLGMVLASPLLAILFNVLRLIPTVWLYGYFQRTTADTFHDVSGWLMPLAAFLSLLGIVRLLRWAMVPVTRFTLAYRT